MNTLQDVFQLILAVNQRDDTEDTITLVMVRISVMTGMHFGGENTDMWERFHMLMSRALVGEDVDDLLCFLNHIEVDAVDLTGFVQFSGDHGSLLAIEERVEQHISESIAAIDDINEQIDAFERYQRGELKPLYINGGLVQPLYRDDLHFDGALCN